jgi:hypothetical protein
VILYNDARGVRYSSNRGTEFHHRTALTGAVSSNGGRSWHSRKLVESDLHKSHCLTGSAFHGDHALLTYYVGVAGGPSPLDLEPRSVHTAEWIAQAADRFEERTLYG